MVNFYPRKDKKKIGIPIAIAKKDSYLTFN